jgi:hypothetical protein
MSRSTDISDVPVMDDAVEEPDVVPAAAAAAKKEWYDVLLQPQFLKSVAIAAVVIAVTFLSPVSDQVLTRLAVVAGVPHAAVLVNALIAAFIVTVLRPPAAAGAP